MKKVSFRNGIYTVLRPPCESVNVEVQWKNIKEYILNTISDLVSKIEKKAKKKTMDHTGNNQ
jgi:hypothetical protein